MRTVEIKICGLTRLDDARCALELGADYLGFVLYPKSPRGIAPARLARLTARLPAGARTVAVFVNAPRAEVERVARDCGLWAVQLHGDEDPRDYAGLPVPLWRSLAAAGPAGWNPAPARWGAARYVVDASAPGVYGGSGRLADWPRARRLARRRPVMLAGGLTPRNVAAAIDAVQPLGVDVASGVEREPGRKDRAAMGRFVAAARTAQ